MCQCWLTVVKYVLLAKTYLFAYILDAVMLSAQSFRNARRCESNYRPKNYRWKNDLTYTTNCVTMVIKNLSHFVPYRFPTQLNFISLNATLPCFLTAGRQCKHILNTERTKHQAKVFECVCTTSSQQLGWMYRWMSCLRSCPANNIFLLTEIHYRRS